MNNKDEKVVVITGGAKGIGRCTAEMFMEQGAKVCVIDLLPQPYETDLYFRGDISKEDVLREFAAAVLDKYGHVDCLVNNAILQKVLAKNS